MPSITPVALTGLSVVGLAVLGAGLYVATTGLGRMRTARRLRDAGPIPLSDVPGASGLVEFDGTARPSDGDLLEAPLSGEPCLAYTVESRSREGDDDAAPGAREWRVDGGAAASVPFLVEDGPDRVGVDPANAVLSLDWTGAETAWLDGDALSAERRERLATTGLPGVGRDGAERTNGTGTGRIDRSGAETGDSSRSGTAADRTDGAPTSSRDELRDRQYRERRLEPGTEVRVFGGSVAESSDRDLDAPVTVAGDDWFEISTGDAIGGGTVLNDRRRSGSLYVIFGGLLAVPGIGLTIAGIVGLVSVLLP